MGMWMRWRLIHSAVEPLSVMATMALAPRWWAVNSAPMAIDWSMRENWRPVNSASLSGSSAASAAAQILAISCTVSSGYLPAAVSALSMTASVPSSTALATSLTSARSILAIRPGLWSYWAAATLHSWRAISMSVAFLGKLTAT